MGDNRGACRAPRRFCTPVVFLRRRPDAVRRHPPSGRLTRTPPSHYRVGSPKSRLLRLIMSSPTLQR
ncbi:hypothetical protein ACFPRL_00990 [Pseudoclavibacter helvolus]